MAGKVSEAYGLEAVGSLIHCRWPRGLNCCNQFALPDLSKDGVLLPESVNDLDRQVGLSVALTSEVSCHRRFINSTVQYSAKKS